MLLSQDRDRAMLDELIGPTNANDRCGDSCIRQMLHDGATETVVENVILERADHVNTACKELESADIQSV